MRDSAPPVEPEAERLAGPSLSIVGAPDPASAPPFNGSRDPEPEPDSEPASNGTPAGARLLATQMAVSGSSREEIEQRLRSGFQIADATSILDAILGPER
jgi:hypothetical protein